MASTHRAPVLVAVAAILLVLVGNAAATIEMCANLPFRSLCEVLVKKEECTVDAVEKAITATLAQLSKAKVSAARNSEITGGCSPQTYDKAIGSLKVSLKKLRSHGVVSVKSDLFAVISTVAKCECGFRAAAGTSLAQSGLNVAATGKLSSNNVVQKAVAATGKLSSNKVVQKAADAVSGISKNVVQASVDAASDISRLVKASGGLSSESSLNASGEISI